MRIGFSAGTAVAATVMLVACKPAATPTVAPTVAVAPVPAFSATDEAAIKADAIARLTKRTTGAAIMGTLHSCSEYFSLGNPRVIDSTLGEQAGKVRLLIPITVFHPEPSGTAPDIGCYGYAHPGWLLNQPYNVTFEFQVERWQTGWRIAQIQQNGF
ncbi:MAG: hypothetical protein JWR80_6151 [Bradyrhizobium sp.]|nr:hypothetical protein [Bradyrhizobium sp.]